VKSVAVEIVLAQQALKGAPFLAGGSGRMGHVSLMLRKKTGEIAALEGSDGLFFGLP
jgi:hypothetical protein